MNAVTLESLNGNAEELYICRPIYNKSITDLPSDQGLRMASFNINGLSTQMSLEFITTNDIDTTTTTFIYTNRKRESNTLIFETEK